MSLVLLLTRDDAYLDDGFADDVPGLLHKTRATGWALAVNGPTHPEPEAPNRFEMKGAFRV